MDRQQNMADNTQDIFSMLDQIFSPAGPMQPNPMIETLQGSMADLENQPGPELQQAPAPVNPFAGAASTFGASMADFLGLRGAAQQNEFRLQSNEREIERVNRENTITKNEAFRQKQAARLQLQLQIGELKAAEYEKAGRMDDLLKQAKANFVIDEKLKKMDIEAAKERGDAITARTMDAIKARTAGAEKLAAYKATLSTHTGNDPKAKLIEKRADQQGRGVLAAVDDMRRENEIARSKYMPLPYSAEEIAKAEAEADLQLQEIYSQALADIEGVKPVETTTQTVTKRKPLKELYLKEENKK